MTPSSKDVLHACAILRARIFADPAVVAIGVGAGDAANGGATARIFVRTDASGPAPDILRSSLSEVDAETGGRVKVLVEPAAPLVCGAGFGLALALSGAQLRHRMRPAAGGFSAAHYQFRYATIGFVVRDRGDVRSTYVLGNNHALALLNRAHPGDPVLQPSRDDGGTLAHDVIGALDRFIPIDFGAGSTKRVDVALAQVRFCDVEPVVFGLGYPGAVRRSEGIVPGERVQKVGRTSGLTFGRIVAVRCALKIYYGPNLIAVFENQILSTAMCADGDSGSLVLDIDGNVMGLLFGISGTHTAINYAEDVEGSLGVVICDRHL
jgi:Trypsin-like peptidase domain